MPYLHSPLGLRNHIKAPCLKLEWIPFLNILCIAFFLSLLSSKYIFAPGLTIDLPRATEKSLSGKGTSAILSVNEINLIFFEGNIYDLGNIEIALKTFINNNIDNTTPAPILLIKASKKTEMNTIFDLCKIARNVGFSNIQLAANINDGSELKQNNNFANDVK